MINKNQMIHVLFCVGLGFSCLHGADGEIRDTSDKAVKPSDEAVKICGASCKCEKTKNLAQMALGAAEAVAGKDTPVQSEESLKPAQRETVFGDRTTHQGAAVTPEAGSSPDSRMDELD
ncbi:hypothetical protein EBQ93_03100 [bacterium]|nr:hypothetical protein [bacterium]